MEIDIRSHIINNFKDDDKKAIQNAIDSSIKEKDELSLPGLGVLFEILWNNSNKTLKDSILDILEINLK